MYRERRYCRHLSQRELNARIRDVFLSMLTLTREAKVGALPADQHGMRWMQLWTDVLEEMAIRCGPYPSGFTKEILHSEPFPDFAGSLASRAAGALNHVSSAGVLIKFGKAGHMRALYDRGALRVQSASFYKAPDHNGAVRDDEMALELSLALQREQVVKLVSNPEDVPRGELDHRLNVRYESPTDYWMYCLTTAVQPRTFVDFGADACVVIQDPHRFVLAVGNAVSPLVTRATMRHGKVAYIDPLLPPTAVVDVPMSKHFRYSYQHEYRLAWVPPDVRSALTHIDVEVGGLAEYAELITLPTAS
jgi:hypothetical protein